LLDKELERKTEAGVMMHNVLAKGQVVPLAMTMHLLKSTMNLTSSSSLVVENFPTHVDQVDYIEKDFKIDRVFSINSSSQALQAMQEQFTKKRAGKSQSETGAAKAFDEAVKRLEPITAHFAAQGKLERLDVTEKPKERNLEELVEGVLMPSFASVIGMQYSGTAAHALALAESFGASPAVKADEIVAWAKSAMGIEVSVDDSPEFLKALHKFTSTRSSSVIVLDGYPATKEQCEAFIGKFGEPKILADISMPDEELQANAEKESADAGEEDFDGEAFQELMNTAKPVYEALQGGCAPMSCYVKVDGMKGVPECNAEIVKSLNAKAYVVVSPLTNAAVGKHVGAAICSISKVVDKKPVKFSLLDTDVLCKKGGHSQEIEEELTKVSMTAASPDALPVPLWTSLIKEAFTRSPNPLGNFVIANFPTACSTKSYPSVRDQFDILESLCTLQGIIFVKFTEDAYSKFGIDAASAQAYQDYMNKVEEYIDVQYGKVETLKVFKTEIDGASASDSQGALRTTAKKIATEFFKAEKGSS